MIEVLMRNDSVKAYFMKVGCKGYFGEIQNTLSAKQEYVKGYIEVVSLYGLVDIICNEEGKLQNLPFNRAFVDDGTVLDVFVGDILCLRHNDEGDFIDIQESDIEIITKHLIPCVNLGEAEGTTYIHFLGDEELKEISCEE